MRRPRISAGSIAIIGLSVTVLGVALAHQTGADLLIWRCQVGSPVTITLIGGGGVLLAGAGAWIAHAAARDERDSPTRFIAAMTSMIAAVLMFMLLLAIAAIFIIPACYT